MSHHVVCRQWIVLARDAPVSALLIGVAAAAAAAATASFFCLSSI